MLGFFSSSSSSTLSLHPATCFFQYTPGGALVGRRRGELRNAEKKKKGEEREKQQQLFYTHTMCRGGQVEEEPSHTAPRASSSLSSSLYTFFFPTAAAPRGPHLFILYTSFLSFLFFKTWWRWYSIQARLFSPLVFLVFFSPPVCHDLWLSWWCDGANELDDRTNPLRPVLFCSWWERRRRYLTDFSYLQLAPWNFNRWEKESSWKKRRRENSFFQKLNTIYFVPPLVVLASIRRPNGLH